MPDNLTPEDRKKTMRAVKGKNTGLERTLFAMLAGMGLKGWRQNDSSVPGKPDVVFHGPKVVIFVDGCFWHGCPHCQRPMPQTNIEYWQRKIARNVERGESYDRKLTEEGWAVVRIWEHEIKDKSHRADVRTIIRTSANRGNTNGSTSEGEHAE